MLLDIFKETAKGKSIHKILTNQELKEFRLNGKIVDLGGGKKMAWSHFRYLIKEKDINILTVDIDPKNKPDILVNLEKDRINIGDGLMDMVLAFNVLEHIYNAEHVLTESYRVLRSGGEILGSIPFLLRVHPDPKDYFRYTKSSLEKLLRGAGFREVKIKSAGLGPAMAGYLQVEPYIPRILRIFFVLPNYIIDKILLKLRPELREFYPLGYIFFALK